MKFFTTSLDYADFLRTTLPAWTILGDVHVISHSRDKATAAVCEEFGVTCHTTEAWFVHDAICNKGAAQTDIINQVAKAGETMGLFDADCYPIGVPPDDVASGVIFGCRRYKAMSKAELQGYLYGKPLPEIRVPISYRPHLIRGYFQLFRFEGDMKFGRYIHTTFSGCDLWFASLFPQNLYLPQETFHVIHLGQQARNWKGRITEEWK